MNVKVGDTVRFLNISGGGVVVRLEGKLAFVEDEDGFEVPMLINEVVVIKQDKPKSTNESASVSGQVEEPDDYEYIEEGDDANPQFLIAFLSGAKAGQDSGDLRIQAINDSNFFMSYNISTVRKDKELDLLYAGTIEPNTKLSLDKMTVMQLDDRQWQVNLMLFKRGKSYANFAPVSSVLKIKAARFMKDNAFADNAYYHEKAVLLPVIKGEFERKLEELSDTDLQKASREKENKPKRQKYAKRDEPGILEVDLHIDELIDSTTGLSNGEIITIQLDKFKQVMTENANNKGRKVVFIHGVGSGTLKTEVRKLLDRQFRKHSYQDASFREYGYGATMVII